MGLQKRASSWVSVPRARRCLELGASTREDGTTANQLDMISTYLQWTCACGSIGKLGIVIVPS